jgi:protein-serine/threonine kinase
MTDLDSSEAADGEGPDGSDKPPHDDMVKLDRNSLNRPKTPSTASSPTVSESECWSAPSTRPPSNAPSRAPSVSARTPSREGEVPPGQVNHKDQSSFDAQQPADLTLPPLNRRKTASVQSGDSGGHKFNLKDLLASGPKLARRSSGSSRKSDSDGGAKSNAGDSAASLSKKYGVCQKVAIGKGATSVVRLAHKWDRSEEKLYAVKVRSWFMRPHQDLTLGFIGIPEKAEE